MANLTRHESRQAAFQILFALEKEIGRAHV